MYGSLIPLVIILKPCKDLIPELCTKWFEEFSGPLCFAFNNAKNRWLSHRQGMWSQLCGMNIWSDGWQSRLTSFENTGTTSSTSSKVQVLRVIALTLPPMWVILYTTAHFPFTAPYSNSQYNMSSMLLSLVNRSIFSSSHRSLIILIVPAIIYIDKWVAGPCFSSVHFSWVSGCSLSEVSKEHLENGQTLVGQMFGSLWATWLQRER